MCAPTTIDRPGRVGLKPSVRDDVIVHFLETLTILAGEDKRARVSDRSAGSSKRSSRSPSDLKERSCWNGNCGCCSAFSQSEKNGTKMSAHVEDVHSLGSEQSACPSCVRRWPPPGQHASIATPAREPSAASSQAPPSVAIAFHTPTDKAKRWAERIAGCRHIYLRKYTANVLAVLEYLVWIPAV